VSLINGKPAVEWTFDRETVLSPNFGPDQSDYYWQITAPCMPWPTCAFDHPTAGEPLHTEQTPPNVTPHTPDVPVPLPGTLALLVLGAIMLQLKRSKERRANGKLYLVCLP